MLILDHIIGPILKSLGLIEIDESGEWFAVEKTPKEKGFNYDRKENNEPGLLSKFIAWVKKQWEKLKTLFTKKKAEVSQDYSTRNTVTTIQTNSGGRKKIYKCKSIPKMEANILISQGYGLEYVRYLPEDKDIQPHTVYVVIGGGKEISSSIFLRNIRYDAFYIYDEVTPPSN